MDQMTLRAQIEKMRNDIIAEATREWEGNAKVAYENGMFHGADAMLELLWPVIEAAENTGRICWHRNGCMFHPELAASHSVECDLLFEALTQLKGRVMEGK